MLDDVIKDGVGVLLSVDLPLGIDVLVSVDINTYMEHIHKTDATLHLQNYFHIYLV